MLNTGITSSISLRTRGSLSFTTNDYSHCSNERSHFACSSYAPWCSCCCNSIYAIPFCPKYGSTLHGLKQSSLIQWSCYRRPIWGGFDYYARLPACDIDRMCYCDKVCNFSEGSVGRRRGVVKKRFVYEERSESYDLGGVDEEAEAMLSLLADDLGEECLLVRKETRILVRKPEVEKRESGDLCRECGSNKKRVGLGVLKSDTGRDHGSVVSSRKDDSRRRKERIQSVENEEAITREEYRGSSSKNRKEKRIEERDALLKIASQKSEEKLERELIRKQNLKLRSRMEEKEEMLRREHSQMVRKDQSRTEEEHRQKLRKDGSSCSSYYTVSSTGDYDSGNEVELLEGAYLDNSSTGLQNYSTKSELVYQDTREEEQRRADYRDDFRKKSEKRLVDVSVEEMDSKKETSLKESKSTITHQRNQNKSTDYVIYDDRNEKSTERMRYDENRKQQLSQAGGEVSRHSETMLKHKQFVGKQDILSGNVIDTTGSQSVYSRTDEMSAKAASSNQKLSFREDEYHRNSQKVSEVSEIQEIDVRKTSTSQQHLETYVKRDGGSTSVSGFIDNAEHQQQYDQVSGEVELRGKSQKLIKEDSKSILKTETDEFVKQEENANLSSTSSSESKEPYPFMHAKITQRGNSRNESDELNKVRVTHSGHAGVIWIEDRNRNKSEISTRPPPDLPEISTISLGSTAGIAIDDAGNGSLLVESTTLHGSDVQGSVAIHPEPYVGAESDTSHGESSRLVSDGDAMGSAARLEKSSTHYVGEFIEQARSEILISETHRQKETYKTEILHKESSGDPRSNEHGLERVNQQSGTKGPADEMWNVDEPPIKEPVEAEVQDNASNNSDVIVKRTGKSLWNIIADIARLRWSHSESHDSGRKTGARSSPNQSTSSEKWFSEHEAEENEETLEEIESRSSRQYLPGSRQQGKPGSQVEESPSSSNLEGHPRHVGLDVPSSSLTQERRPLQASISLPIGGEIPGDTSSATIIDSSIPLPALRLRRSPAIRGVPEVGEVQASGSGMIEQVDIGLAEQTESVVNKGEAKQNKLQRKDQAVRDRFDEWEEAYRLEAEQQKIDETFMREALLEAQKAADNWEVPVGAVLVQNGKIIARGCNLVEELRDSTAHAELLCIREASNKLRTWRLSETTLYVTLEPCPMCAGAVLQARIDTLVWGAPNKLLGADGSWIRLFPGDGGTLAEQSDKPAAPVHPFHPKMSIRRGVLAADCADAMQQFFKRRRKKDNKSDASSSCLPISNRPSNFMTKMHNAFSLFCL